MNSFRKLLVVATLLLGGCATQQEAYKEYLSNVQQSNATVAAKNAARAQTESDKYMALAYIAKTATDPATKQMAVMAIALGTGSGGGGTQEAQAIAPQAPQNEALQWASVLMNPIVTLGTGYFGYKANITASNNAANTTIASYNAFSGIATAGLNTAGNIALGGFQSNQNIATAGFNSITGTVGVLGQPNVTTINGNGNGVQYGGGTQNLTYRPCTPAGSGNAGNGAAGGAAAPGGPGGSGGGSSSPGGTGGNGASGGLGGNGGASGAVTANCN